VFEIKKWLNIESILSLSVSLFDKHWELLTISWNLMMKPPMVEIHYDGITPQAIVCWLESVIYFSHIISTSSCPKHLYNINAANKCIVSTSKFLNFSFYIPIN
jgi:hypothetical protein